MSLVQKGIRPITETFLGPNDLFALVTGDGWFFGKVLMRKPLIYKPYALIDEQGNVVDIPPSGFQPAIRLKDPRDYSNSLLFLTRPTAGNIPTFLHGGIGITPSQVFMYPQYPTGSSYGEWPTLSVSRPDNGDNIAYVNADLSPYNNPTNWIEYVITPRQDVVFAFYNKDSSRTHRPVLNIMFMQYFVKFFRPSQGDQNDLIRAIATRKDVGENASILVHGFLGSQDTLAKLDQGTIEDWHLGGEALTLEEASRL